MQLVDSHCHLNFPDYKDDLPQVIAHAHQSGVVCMQTICTKMQEFEDIRTIAENNAHIYCSIGVHPNNVEQEELVDIQDVISKTSHNKVIGVGETGLDYYYEHSPRERQKESFRRHIAVSRETQLPVIVHSRNADEDTIAILAEEKQKGDFPGLIHCFSTTRILAEGALNLGMYISIAGIITFKKAEELREIVKEIPLERLLVETDAPYLAPTPFRGKRNEPEYVKYTNRMIAEIKNISEEDSASATTKNFFRLFSKAEYPEVTSA